MLLFLDVKYYLSPSLPQELQSKLSISLADNGATRVPLDEATHVITNSNQFEGWETVADTVFVTTDQWVTQSIFTCKIQQPQFYSADPSMIFSGVIACATELPDTDVEILSAGITALGGQWRMSLTRDVTHLFAISPGSQKYETALHFQDITKVKIVVPHWFDDAVRLGMKFLPTSEYEWPEPRLFRKAQDGEGDEGKKVKTAADKKVLYKTAIWTPGKDIPVVQASQRDIWQGRRILLSPSLGLAADRREAVAAGIRRGNGVVIEYNSRGGNGDEEEEARKIQEAEILVTRYRSGAAYAKAVKAHKTIGTLAWLFHVESIGVLSRPLDQLLHYPIPKKPIEGFSAHEITVTNYTGEAREYLKKLISIMGAQFTPSMSGKNTVLIAAYSSGNKATKAVNWSIPVVNHTWLEDCFVQWRNLTVGLEKYIVFPPGVDFAQMLGERGVGRAALDEMDLGLVDADDGSELQEEADKQNQAPTGTNTSAKEANEVENAVGLFDVDADPFVDVEGSGNAHAVSPQNLKSVSKSTSKPTSKASPKRGPSSPFSGPTKGAPKAQMRHAASLTEQLDTLGDPTNEAAHASKPASKPTRRAPPRVELPVHSPEHSPINRRKHRRLTIGDEDAGDAEAERDPGPSTKRRKAHAPSDGEHESEIEVHRKVKATKMKIKPTSPPVTSDDDDIPTPPPKTTLSRAQLDAPVKRIPNMIVEATPSIPSPVRIGSSPRKVPSVVITTLPTGSPTRTGTILAAAAETSLSEKRERHVVVREPSQSPARTSSTPSTLVRASTKRSAATRAIQKLHDEIMPDVLNFQQEMKGKGKGKGKGKERIYDRSRDDEDVNSNKKKGKKRASDVHSVFSSDEEARDAKKQRPSKRAVGDKDNGVGEASPKSKMRPPASDDEQTGYEADHGKPARKVEPTSNRAAEKGSGAKNRISDASAKSVRLMTTQVNLPDDVLKILTKLGMKITTKPSECTHLLAPHLVRTEKFLCALAVAPFILSEKWALESAAAKKLLPEDDYILYDPENEKKYDFKLADSMRRAKDIGGRLFLNHTFYVTPKVPVDSRLLKNVVVSGGGQFSMQPPTLRILSAKENRHVISCPADTSIWRPLAQHQHPIYTHELLLTSTLKQQVDWADVSYKVQGSDI